MDDRDRTANDPPERAERDDVRHAWSAARRFARLRAPIASRSWLDGAPPLTLGDTAPPDRGQPHIHTAGTSHPHEGES